MEKNRHTTAHHWGPGVAITKDGRLESLDAHPLDPDPSPINTNIPGSLYGEARVRKPAIRKSYLESGPDVAKPSCRGEEAFIEVDYDTALDLIAKELERVKHTHGNQSIFAGSYGWASAGRFHHAQSQLKRFLNCYGGFVRSEGNYSYNAALRLMPYIVGDFREHVKQATRWQTVAREGQLVVMFGGIPLRNTQVSGGGIAKHRLLNDLKHCAESGVKFVNLSPFKSDSTDLIKAQWLPIRPCSDTAAMMGLAHWIVSNNKHDQAALDRMTVGFPQVYDYLLGKSDGVVKDVYWASKICDVPAPQLITLAEEMVSKRTLICTAVSLQRQIYGEQPLWMTVTLAAVVGQIGLPGGGYGIGYGADASIGTVDRPFRWPSFPQGSNPVMEFVPVACLADMLLNPGAKCEYNGKRFPYPDIKLVWWAGGNPFHHHQDLNKLRQAFQQPDTIIVNEINWTSTARHADIVLPATSALERNDFAAGTQDNAIIPMSRVIEPLNGVWDEYKIYCEMEKRLDLGQAFSQGRSVDEWLESMWKELQAKGQALDYEIPAFSEFMAGDIIEFPDPNPDSVFLSDFRRSPESNPLPTPSGKIELYSEVISSFDYQECPGHAAWLHDTDSFASHTLQLVSGQPATRLHSQFDNGEYSKSHKVQGREPVLIHPTDADSRAIKDGDVVRLANAKGSCLAGAVISEKIKPGVVFLWTGAWYEPDFKQADQQDKHGNPNVLTSDTRTSRLSQGPAVNAIVEVEKFTGNLPEITIYKPPLQST